MTPSLNTFLEEKKKEFQRKFGIDDDWDSELYQKVPSGWSSANKEVWSFISASISEAYQQGFNEAMDLFLEELRKIRYECVGLDISEDSYLSGKRDGMTELRQKINSLKKK